ncbi:MAG: hypothetical protein EYC70_12885 [Planctomycetota bacterium]|nr:MAG: hypothetical protein EYC70_12885 [Planctomycetota bacterium]
MPKAWSKKDERQYEHHKDSELDTRTVAELRNRARTLRIPGRSRMARRQLIAAIRRQGG